MVSTWNAGSVLQVLSPSSEASGGPQLALSLEHLPGVVWTTDCASTITQAVGRGFAAAGVDAGLLVGRKIDELPDASPATVEAQSAALVRGESSDYVVRYRDRDFEVHVEPVLGSDGAVVGTVGSSSDVTERLELERQLRAAEEQKLAGETRYHDLFERAIDVMVVLDLEGQLIDVNPAATRLLGYSREDLIGRPLFSFVAPDEVDAAVARFASKVDGSVPASFNRTVLVSNDGRRVPVEVDSAVMLRDGEPYGVLAIARDVSEQIAAREALEESEQRFRSAFEGAAIGMNLTDARGAVVWANAAFTEMLGYQPSELVGMRMDQLVHPEDLAPVEEDIESLRSGVMRRCVVEKRYLRKDGGIILGRVSISTARDDDGSILYFVGQVEDVTELRRVQAELDESQVLHRLVFESSRDVLSVFGIDGSIRLVSPSVEAILGYHPRDVVGLDYADFIHPDDMPATATAVLAAVQGRPSPLFRSRFLAADGSYRLWEGTVSPGLGPDGEVDFLVANSRDVTAQVELEDQLRQAQKMEAIGRLAGGVAHDFNNMLLAIRGYAELARGEAERGEDNSAGLGEIMAAADRAASLTAQLLAFSRRQVLNPEILDVRDVVAGMASLLRRLISGNVELVTLSPDEPVLIEADRTQIEQVIANLAVNARDAMPDGGRLTIEISVADGRVQLAVSDDGMGMDVATAAQIFEPFFTTKGVDGTGLGLSMVHGIVNQSGGEIAVSSTQGEGTTFTVSFPLAAGTAAPSESARSEPAAGGAETILLVEDDAIVNTIIQKMLERHGYRVLSAANGEEAIAIAHADPDTVDLILSDLVMPGLNGRETVEALSDPQPLAKVLYMSGYTDDVVIRVGRFEPGVAFIQKPFGVEELALRVRELLDARVA